MKPKHKTNAQTHKASTSKQGTDPNSYFVSLFNSISDALVATDLDFNILEWNPAAEELYGWKNVEALGHPLRELIQSEYGNTTWEKVIEIVLEQGIWRGEVTQNRSDGSRFPAQVSISLVHNETDQPVGFIAIHRDISERKQAESQVIQMKRLYATLSQVNQVIVRIKERTELFQTICNVSVQFGEFPLAWVGLVDESSGDVRPVASATANGTQSHPAILNIYSELLKDALIATAVRTLKVSTSENIRADLHLSSSQSQFESFRYRAVAIIPFLLEGKTTGVLALHSEEQGMFQDQDEIKLLDEMGLDISFALDNLENEKKHREAKAALKESEERFSTAFFVSPVAQSIISQGTNEIMAVNDVCCHLFGYPREELIGTSTAKLSLWENPADRLAAVEELQRDGRLQARETTVRMKSGEIRTVIVAITPILWKGIPSLISSLLDITDRKRAEEELRQSEERLRLSLLAANQGLYDLNVQTGDTIVNRQYAEMLGYDFETFVETNAFWIERLHPDDREITAKAYRDYIDGLLPEYRVEFRQRTKNGNWKWILSLGKVIEYDSQGSPLRMLGTHTDITERKMAEIALRSSEENYRSLAEHSESAIAVLDRNGYILYANPAGTKIWNDPRILGKTIFDIYPEEYARRYDTAIKQVIDHKLTIQNDVESSINGRLMWFRVIMSPLKNPDGTVTTLLLNAWDMTERKQVEEALRISEQTARRMANSLRMVNEISTKITSGLDLERLLQALYEECQRIGDTDQFYVSLYDYATEMLSFPFNYEDGHPSPIPSRPNHTVQGFTEYILEHRQTLHIPDTTNLPPEGALNRKPDDPTRSYIGVPLMVQDRVVGVLSMQSHRPSAYTLEQIHTLELLATQAAIAIQNAQLFEQAQQEITERRQAEEKLRASEEQYRRIVETSQEGVFVFDANWQLSFANAQFQQILGYAPGELLGKPIDDIILQEDKTAHEKRKARQMAGIKGVYENAYRRKDGTAVWLQISISPLIEKGKLVGSFGMATDITERKLAEEQLLTLNAQLEERVRERTLELHQTNIELEDANRAKDEFLAMMSHELRTPLNSILGLSESLLEQRRDPLSDYQQKSLEIVQASGQHLLELINDILDLSKLDAGKFDIYPQVVEVASLCQSSLTFVKQQAIQKSILLACQEDEAVSKIYADPRRLKQILVNLLTNAVKFTPEHGTVTLQIHADAARNRIQFSVIDTGIGIAAESMNRLFQPFVQVDSSLNRQFEGTGLGLVLVQKLIDLHGGSVEVESEVGRGSRFTINLPWEKEKVIEKERKEMIEASGETVPMKTPEKSDLPSKERVARGIVLLAEDNPANTLTIADYLENHGYRIVFARDGSEAIQRAEETNPDIILMDVQMPVLDGLEAIRRLRAHRSFTATPIIALTALAMPGDRERCLAAGANEYMSKPVSLKELRKTIEELLES